MTWSVPLNWESNVRSEVILDLEQRVVPIVTQSQIARLRSFISSVILPSSLSYVPCTVLKFRALDRFPGINVPGIFYSRNFLNWVLNALFHPLARQDHKILKFYISY